MTVNLSRRTMLYGIGAAALTPKRLFGADVAWPPAEGVTTPKICLGAPPDADQATLRRYKQIGVDYVLMGGPRIPWEEADMRARMDRYKAAGITIINMMIGGFDDVIWGKSNADTQIENVIKS